MNKGTYAGVKFDHNTNAKIHHYLKTNDIPNPVPLDKLHSTLLYSRKYLPSYEAMGKIYPPKIGIPEKFEIWKSQDGKNCLVLLIKCSFLQDRHKKLMKEHEATFDYPTYNPHVTFSYDVGGKPLVSFPKYDGWLLIDNEYKEDLDLNWADGTKSDNKERKKERKENE